MGECQEQEQVPVLSHATPQVDEYRRTPPLAHSLILSKTPREQGLADDGASELGYIDIINHLIDESWRCLPSVFA